MSVSSDSMFSLEFFPPRDTAAQERLVVGAQKMLVMQPHYCSVTFGAGGSTRDGTLETVRTLREMGCDAAPHLSCIGASHNELRALLAKYQEEGIRRIVALRGDLPSGMGLNEGALRYASDLVEFIRHETGDWFHIEVGAYPEMHPQASGPERDLDHFVRKVEAGADSAITQYFFNADAYFDFVDRATARGVDIPIVPGIMPITNHNQLMRVSEMCDDKASIKAFGAEVVTQLCQTLIENEVPGLHFYTLNNAEATLAIWRGLTQ